MLSFTVAASATVFLLYFLLASEHWLIARTDRGDPAPAHARAAAQRHPPGQVEIGLFITTMGLISIGLGIATGIGLAAIGFPNPVLWGTTTAVLTFVPYIGRCSSRSRCWLPAAWSRAPAHDAGAAGALPRPPLSSRAISSAR
jgi:predicted PurR-regulated permease PerM